MNIDELLVAYNDVYLSIDSENCVITNMTPSKENVFPISYEDFVNDFFGAISQVDRNKLLTYLFRKNKTKNCNILIKKKWYSLEYKKINEAEFVHLYLCHKAIITFKDDVTLNQEDPLSGLLHKIAFSTYVEHQIENNVINAGTLFMIDIDYFKNINDNYGHMFGDEVIKEVSNALKTISEKATVGRIGGDEFAIFIEDDLERESVRNYARLIRYLLGRIVINGETYPITSTIGICQYPKNGSTFEELYSCCDKALYAGKIKGRDCHVFYDPIIHEKGKTNGTGTEKLSLSTGSVASLIHEIVNSLLVDNLSKDQLFEISSKIVNYFSLDRIVIAGFDDIRIIYDSFDTKEPKEDYKKIDLNKYFKLFTYNNSFIMNDVYTLNDKDEEFGSVYLDAGVNSFIQVLIKDKNDEPLGFISYEMLKEKRVWQVGEINNLVIISNIINSFLLKFKIDIK